MSEIQKERLIHNLRSDSSATTTAVEGNGNQRRNEDVPPAKKSKMSDSEPEAEEGDGPYPFAKLRGIRIFSEREINGQGAEMTRAYWTFWNSTAEDLCSDGAYNDWGKRDLKLYIDAAWVIHKTNVQEIREQEIREAIKDLEDRYGSSELPAKLRTEDENVTELLAQLQDSTANLTELNVELGKSRGKFMNIKQRPTSPSYTVDIRADELADMKKSVSEREKNLYAGMAEVKKDQDSTKKALTRLSNLIQKAKQNCSSPPSVILDQGGLQTIEATIITT